MFCIQHANLGFDGHPALMFASRRLHQPCNILYGTKQVADVASNYSLLRTQTCSHLPWEVAKGVHMTIKAHSYIS